MAASTARWQRKLGQGRELLDARFCSGGNVSSLLRARSRLVDDVLKGAWGNEPELRQAGLFAVGGYGRGELFPFSDVDILVLHPQGAAPRQAMERFLSWMWDVGLRPSHSVRDLDECVSEGAQDLSVLTAMLEARQLCGDPGWSGKLGEAIAPDKVWSVPEFFRARIAEQAARRSRHSELMHNLEPSIKETCGGLRDLHMLYWISLRCYGEGGSSGLWRNGLINSKERTELRQAQQFLSRLRYALHMVAGRAEEKLLFEYQRAVAAAICGGDGSQDKVEDMMRSFCRAAGVVDLSNEILLRDFEQRILPPSRPRRRALNPSFEVMDSRLRLRDSKALQRQPQAVVEAFALLAKSPRLRGLDAATMRAIRDYSARNGAALRGSEEVREAMLRLLKAKGAGKALRLMHRYGALDALLPPFGQVRGLTQFDLFHVYSVDVHTMFVLENLDDFFARREDEYPEYHGLSKAVARPEVLYLAALFHDVAKGRGGNHSELGAADAERYCGHLGLGDDTAQTVGWLVRNHLLMSHTSQKEDVNDPETCDNFAAQVGDLERLNLLYLLTAADIRATNPSLWNHWKHYLLSTLYRRTLSRLRQSQADLPAQRLHERQQKALALLSRKDAEAAAQLWRDWHEDTFRRYQPEEIALQTRHVLRNPGQRTLMLLQPRTSRSCTEVFLYMPTRNDSFAIVTRALDQLNLNVVDARIILRERGEYTLDSYAMLEQDGRHVRSRARIEEIRSTLHKALRGGQPSKLSSLPPMRMPSRLRQFRVATEVAFALSQDHGHIVMEVTALDQPGLLSRIATILHNAKVPLLSARVTTFGERAEDVFYLPGDVPPRRCERLREEIIVATGFAKEEPAGQVAS